MRLWAILLAILAWASPAAAAWRQAQTSHFVIYADDSEEGLRTFATRLEKYDAAMRALHGLSDPDYGPANRVTIFAVDDAAAVQRLGRMGSDLMGFYVPRAGGSVAFVPRSVDEAYQDMTAQSVLLHEYAHHFLYRNQPGAYPTWFVEGSAEFYSTARFDEDGGVTFGLPPEHRALELFVWGNGLTLREMLDKLPSELNSREVVRLYGKAWLLTHYLRLEPTREGQLTQYLAAINRGQPSLDAAKAAFGSLGKLESAMGQYKKREHFAGLHVDPAMLKVGDIAIRTLGPGEAAMMDVHMVSRRGVGDKAASELVPEARSVAAPFPSDPLVQSWLAEAEYDAGNFAEAGAAADRAIAANPKQIEALIYKGRAMMAAARKTKSKDPKRWQEIRDVLAAANRLDPDHPEPLILFYNSFRAQGVPVSENAMKGLKYAYALAPYDRGLRLLLADQLLMDGNAAEARTVLASVAYDPHGDETARIAAQVMRRIDAGDLPAARKAWKGATESVEDAFETNI
jgi:tetratricopeptide (TPR) repeat protein